MRLLVALALLVPATAPVAIQPAMSVYDFQWQSVTTLSRWSAGDTATERGELYGRGELTLARLPDGSARFEFSSPVGNGGGRVADGTPLGVTFPTALEVGTPPAPPHLTGGAFKPVGDPQRPDGFELTYAEGFICRTTPDRCGNVMAWSRELSGTATLLR